MTRTRRCFRGGLAAAALALLLCFAAPPAAGGLEPDIGTVDSLGLARLIDQARGRVVVVNFWATWCGPCRTELPDLERLRAGTPQSELAMFGVSVDFDRDMLREFLRDNPFSYPTYFADSALMSELELDAIPKTWVFAPDGTLVQDHEGPLSYEALRSVVELARGGAAKEE